MADNNVYQQVELYQSSLLPLMENLDPFIMLANKKFDNFNSNTYSYGAAVSFDLPVRTTIEDGLVASFTPVEQPKHVLTVNKKKNGSYIVADDNHIFQQQDVWAEKYGRGFIAEYGTVVGSDIASVCETDTYRAYGDGVTAINSVEQLAQMLADLRNYGAANTKATVILPDVKMPAIIDSGLAQFVTKRNDEFANSWQLGSWNNADFYTSNLLPTHMSGTVGTLGDTLTVDSISGDGSQITFSGASSDLTTFLENDIITLDPDKLYTNTTQGGQGAKFLTWIGHKPSSQSVQVRVTADANAVAGVVTVSIFPALNSTTGDYDENVNFDITDVAGNGLTAVALNSHICGLVYTADPLYVAMPRLPEMRPFDSVSTISDEGASIRLSYGSIFGQGEMGWIFDGVYGYTLVPRYAMRIAFQING